MSDRKAYDAFHAEATFAPADAVATPQQLELIHDELILLSLKPSPWMIASQAAPFVGGVALLVVGLLVGAQGQWSFWSAAFLQVLCLLAAGRVGLSVLQWATTFYMLTNRRVLRLAGMANVDVRQLRLVRVGHSRRLAESLSRLFDVGHIEIHAIGDETPLIRWDYVGQVNEVYEILLHAVRKAQAGE